MTPEEQQQKQAELAALQAMHDTRLTTSRDILTRQAALKEIGHLLSDRDKVYYQQDMAQRQQEIKDIVSKWQQDPYNVAPGRDGIYHALRAREDALGLPHQTRQQLPQQTPDEYTEALQRYEARKQQERQRSPDKEL
jgi:hypothetical protein